jgi:lipopolysaccharide export system permease protein
VLVYFVYSNLLSAGKVWLAREVVPDWLGLWWTHAAIALLALGVILVPQWRARLGHRDAPA